MQTLQTDDDHQLQNYSREECSQTGYNGGEKADSGVIKDEDRAEDQVIEAKK